MSVSLGEETGRLYPLDDRRDEPSRVLSRTGWRIWLESVPWMVYVLARLWGWSGKVCSQ